MQLQHTANYHFQKLLASDLDELAATKLGKNRRYFQLQPGKLNCDLTQFWFDGILLGRERLSAGIQLEASPPGNMLPFGAVVSAPGGFRFCGNEIKENTLLQATGGTWNMYTQGAVDYVGVLLDKDALAVHVERLTGRQMSQEWLVNRALEVNTNSPNDYARWMVRTLSQLEGQPSILDTPNIRRLLSAQILQHTVNVLTSTDRHDEKLMPQTRRLRGVRRVIEYLKTYPASVPTIPELCEMAQLSERSLEYGFREELGVTPVRYLKLVRLNAARKALRAADPRTTKVVDIALNLGFFELGRFAGEYRKLFKERPSETLRCM